MLSAGMFSALAARMAPRSRGLVSGSPPPFLAAIPISLIRRVKILPRLASSAPFLCLIVAHFEWPDMALPHPNEVVCDRYQCAGFARRVITDLPRILCRRIEIIARRRFNSPLNQRAPNTALDLRKEIQIGRPLPETTC